MSKWTPEEQRAHRDEWVKALRSGEYKQGKGRLRTDDCFCGLGVAEDVRGAKWVCDEYGVYRVRGSIGVIGRNEMTYAGKRYYGLTNSIGAPNTGSALSTLNDSGATFTEIADIIESEPEGMFE